VNKKIQIIGEHHVNMDDERGSGRFCLEVLRLANLYFTNKVSVWDSSFAVKGSALSGNLQTSSSQPTNKQISLSSALELKQPGILFCAWQRIQQNFAAIPVLFTNNFGISALVAEFFQKRVQTPLSDMSNMGLISI
jgi:hypothetical protein